MLGTREYTLCSPFRANAHNYSSIWGHTIGHNINVQTNQYAYKYICI